MAQKCLVDGTAYDIKHGLTLIDGTGYEVRGGWTRVGGTETEIKFADLISFTIDASNYGLSLMTYQAERGMTWAEWVASSYNTDGFSIPYSDVIGPNGGSVVDKTTSSWYVKPSAEIVDGRAYTMSG